MNVPSASEAQTRVEYDVTLPASAGSGDHVGIKPFNNRSRPKSNHRSIASSASSAPPSNATSGDVYAACLARTCDARTRLISDGLIARTTAAYNDPNAAYRLTSTPA